jgi:LysM repeat protein
MITLVNLIGKDITKSYIDAYKPIAIAEMKRSGIPASIKLAQGVLESSGGRSDLALQANNHFGIKCGGGWTGRTYYKSDDDFDNDGNKIESCFRQFEDGVHSYVAHTDFLLDPNKKSRYGFLFALDIKDYQAWARGLREAGYATDPSYPAKLISIIEKYKLYEFDDVAFANKYFVTSESKTSTSSNEVIAVRKDERISYSIQYNRNGASYIYATGKETAIQVAKRLDMSLRSFLSYNETIILPQEIVPINSIMFLEKKNRDYDGTEETHIVVKGESIELISQYYGIRTSTLRSLNDFDKQEQPSAGDIIQLKLSRKSVQREKAKNEKNAKKSEYIFNF